VVLDVDGDGDVESLTASVGRDVDFTRKRGSSYSRSCVIRKYRVVEEIHCERSRGRALPEEMNAIAHAVPDHVVLRCPDPIGLVGFHGIEHDAFAVEGGVTGRNLIAPSEIAIHEALDRGGRAIRSTRADEVESGQTNAVLIGVLRDSADNREIIGGGRI